MKKNIVDKSTGLRLADLRKEKKLSQRDLANLMGYKSDTTIAKWEAGATVPNGGKLAKLANILGTTSDYILFGGDKSPNIKPISEEARVLPIVDKRFTELSITYRKLRDEAKDMVNDYANNLLQKQESLLNERLYSYRVYEKLSAGTGYSYLNDGNFDEVYYTGYFDHDFASWVFGDSMEPTYQDGEVVLIKATGYDYDGAIYAVDWDGQTYIKKVFKETNGLRLVSINKQYADKFAPFDENPRIIGKIIGNFMPIEK